MHSENFAPGSKAGVRAPEKLASFAAKGASYLTTGPPALQARGEISAVRRGFYESGSQSNRRIASPRTREIDLRRRNLFARSRSNPTILPRRATLALPVTLPSTRPEVVRPYLRGGEPGPHLIRVSIGGNIYCRNRVRPLCVDDSCLCLGRNVMVTISIVGWSSEKPPGMLPVQSYPEALPNAALRSEVVVLGDRSILELDPATVVRRFGKRRTRVILCPVASSPKRVAAWVLAGVSEVVSPEELPGILREETLRPTIGISEWAPRTNALGKDRRRNWETALSVVARLHHVCVKEWAALLGWSRHALNRICMEACGLTPHEVLWRYCERIVQIGIRNGSSARQIAVSLGLSGSSALYHVYKRRGQRLTMGNARKRAHRARKVSVAKRPAPGILKDRSARRSPGSK